MLLALNSPFRSAFQRAAYTHFNLRIDNPNINETPPPQDAREDLNLVFSSKIVPMFDFQEDQENTPQSPRSAKSDTTVTQSSVSRKIAVPNLAPSFS
jgi:hypothetical protein